MTLGTNISRLRAERGLSQGDLAEALDVSRQSVSKWETDASVPELDKLLRLSRLFGVSLDELVTGQAPGEPAAEEKTPEAAAPVFPPRKIVGLVLLCMAFFPFVVFTTLGSISLGLLYALPALVCGLICFFVPRRPGLWCAWSLYFLIDCDLRFGTRIDFRYVFLTPHITPEMNYVRLAIGWAQFLCALALVGATAVSFRKAVLPDTRRNRLALLYGLAALAGLWLLPAIINPLGLFASWTIFFICDDAAWALLAALVSAALALRRGRNRRQNRKRPPRRKRRRRTPRHSRRGKSRAWFCCVWRFSCLWYLPLSAVSRWGCSSLPRRWPAG